VGAGNLKPLDELKTLDQQVELVGELGELKPIFVRLDEIAKEHPDDFEVQLVVGDIKQHLVNRGTRLKEQQPPAPPPIPGPAAPPRTTATTVKIPPRVPPPLPPSAPPAAAPPAPADVSPPIRLMSSAQFATPPVPPQAPTPPSGLGRPPSGLGNRPSGLKPPPGPPPLPSTVTSPLSATQPPAPTVKLNAGTAPPVLPGPLNTGQQQSPLVTRTEFGAPPMQPPQPPLQPSARAPKPPGGGSLHWKRSLLIGAFIGAVATIAIIALLVNQARKRFRPREVAVATVAVDVATTPPDAAIRVNGDTKCNSPCSLQLAPGSYQITAFLDGYDPATSALNVTAGQPGSVQLALTAQSQSVRILTDLESGKIALDDQPPVDLQEGQYTFDPIAPGPHTIKLTAKSGEASFSFLVAPAKSPEITGTVSARNLIAVLVSSVGSQARVFTSAGPVKLAVNGQPEGDAGPAGVDLKNFHPGADEIVVGDGKDQHSLNESFTPGPMLTAFFKSDLNIGTLVVATSEDDVRVFVNGKEYRRRTKNGQVRIPAIGQVSVRVAKDGFQNEPAQTADVKKGSEVRLEFKLRALPQVSSLQIHGATPGAEVLLDQKNVGAVGSDGNFIYSTVAPGDHTIDLRRDQYTPKHLQRSFKAGQPVVIAGSDAVLVATVTSGTIKISRTPADAAVTYRRADESAVHDFRGSQIELPPGTYVLAAHAAGYSETSARIQLAAGETRNLEITLARVPVAVVKGGDMGDFVDPSAWNRDGELWTHRGGGFIPYKLGPRGIYTFTVELVHGGNLFKGGRIRWCVEYRDSRNYLLYELDHKNFWAEVVENGKKFERDKVQHDLDKQKAFTIQIEITPDRCIHRIKNPSGQWVVLDSFTEPGRDFTKGKFGFLIQGNDEIGVSDFSYSPK